MKNFRFTIKNKIFGGFLFMVVIFIINASISFFNVQKNDGIVKDASEIKRPSSKAINDMKHMVTRSKMLITNWVYLQGNNDLDKEELKNLIEFEYPEIQETLVGLTENWENDSQKQAIDTVLFTFERLVGVADGIMTTLVSFEDYEDPFTKLMAEDAVTSEVLPLTTFMNEKLGVAESLQDVLTNKADQDQIDGSAQMKFITIVAGIIIVVFGFGTAFFIGRSITNPINYIKEVVLKMGEGELPEDQDKKFNNDEIGEMALAMDNLIQGLKDTTDFAENIGKGNYASDFQPLSDNDVLGNALIEMRNNLQSVADEDKKRNWATEGMAKFGDILRSNNSDLTKLSDEIISNLVKYLNCNQGGLFVLSTEASEDDLHLALTSCYAWDKKKYLEQKIHKGDGLVGQSWQEMDTIYITDVPEDYISITSGLGDASPTSILIVPLKVNDEIFGVVELASFNNFEDHEKEFVEKIAESIASTISTVRINAKTQTLLEESQQMTEEMRAQEEEMRQNMEELQATQEEMQRAQLDTEGTIEAINSAFLKLDYNSDGIIQNANDNFLRLSGYDKEQLLGKHHSMLVNEDERKSKAYESFWSDLADGTKKEGEFERKAKSGKSLWVRGDYTPVRNSSGEIVKVIELMYDVTEYKS